MNFEYARVRLEDWGAWARENVSRGIGYPSRSPEQQTVISCSQTVDVTEAPEEEIDKIVLSMQEDLREITKYYYVRRWTMATIARSLSTSRRTISERLDVATGFVAGRLHD